MIHGIEDSQIRIAPVPPGALIGARFDNTSSATGLGVASQNLTDSPLLTASIWFKTNDAAQFPWIVRLAKYTSTAMEIRCGFYNGQGDVSIHLANAQSAKVLEFASDAGVITDGVRHHIFLYANTNFGAGLKLCGLKIDGADALFWSNDPSTAFDLAFNTFPFAMPYTGGGGPGWFTADYADVWIALGQYETDVTKFRNIDGSPVDLGADGSGPTGVAPTYFFHGGASMFGTNAGSGDSVSLTGSLSDAAL